MVYIKICPECTASMYWDEDSNEWVCSVCGKSVATNEDDWDEEEDDDSFVCSSCGNPAYPNCKDGCKLFDD